VTVGGGSVAAPYGTTGNYGNNADTLADEILLPAGGSISTELRNFLRPGGVQGQIWLYPLTTGSIRISSVFAPGPTQQGMGQQDVQFVSGTPAAGQIQTNRWTRVYIDQLSTLGLPATTAPGVTTETFFISNTGGSQARFSAWGATLTQIDEANAPGGGSSNIGFDPGPAMYSTLITGGGDEFLELPTITENTASTGFCLSVDLAPAAGMAWDGNGRFNARGIVSWNSNTSGAYAELGYYGRDLTFRVSNGTTSMQFSPSIQPSWPAGSLHNVKACLEPNGHATIYGDNLPLGGQDLLPVANLADGKVRVGATSAGHWHGWVKKASACRRPTSIADCN
jgi:hypothetical protein